MSRPVSVPTESSNELDLSRYVKVLRRFWWVIAAAAIVGAALGYVYSTLQPVSYRAEAALAILRTGLLLNLDGRARTVSDADPNAQSVDQLARRRALTTIGESQDVAQRVLQALGSPPPSGLETAERIARRVNVSLDNDVVRIQVNMPTAEEAGLLANTYAQVYAQRVNALLGETSLSGDALGAQAAQARQLYQDKENAVSAYLAANQIETLKRQADFITRQLDAQIRTQVKLARLEQDALALQSRLKNGGAIALPGAQVAQILLEANTFNNSFDAPAGDFSPRIEGTDANLTAAEQLQTLDGLLQAIRARRQTLSDAEMQKLYADLNQAQAALEQAQARLKELQAERDLAWNTYQLLATKLAETNITSGYQNEIVRVISPAVVPSSPNASRSSLNTLIGAALGVIVGAALAFLLNWLAFGKKRAAQVETVTTADPAA